MMLVFRESVRDIDLFEQQLRPSPLLIADFSVADSHHRLRAIKSRTR